MYHTVINNQYLISLNGSLQSDWHPSTSCFSEADRAILTACQQRGANRKTFRHVSAQLGNKTAQQVRGGGASVCRCRCSVSKSWLCVSFRWTFASSTSSTCFTSKSPLPVPQMAGQSARRKHLSTEGGAGGRQVCRDCDPDVLLRDPIHSGRTSHSTSFRSSVMDPVGTCDLRTCSRSSLSRSKFQFGERSRVDVNHREVSQEFFRVLRTVSPCCYQLVCVHWSCSGSPVQTHVQADCLRKMKNVIVVPCLKEPAAVQENWPISCSHSSLFISLFIFHWPPLMSRRPRPLWLC